MKEAGRQAGKACMAPCLPPSPPYPHALCHPHSPVFVCDMCVALPSIRQHITPSLLATQHKAACLHLPHLPAFSQLLYTPPYAPLPHLHYAHTPTARHPHLLLLPHLLSSLWEEWVETGGQEDPSYHISFLCLYGLVTWA